MKNQKPICEHCRKMKGTKLGNRKVHMSPLERKKSELLKSEPEPSQHEDNVQITLHEPSLAVGRKCLYLTDPLTSAISELYLVISK